ncbi:hypothetical protein GCM10012289_09990 [Nonomuraea cavernae]|uniref:Uncharacterized protein n=1 Tax=Nonomuraea cavernae TaxID=2045107 RepID=A0A917YPI5_9ACTN|nr:hypothetical protein GCM10012289_09990 [Nonomuraea cavernae]
MTTSPLSGPNPSNITRAKALATAGQLLAHARAERDTLSPAEAARLAHRPGGIPLEDLEASIRAQRERARTTRATSAA